MKRLRIICVSAIVWASACAPQGLPREAHPACLSGQVELSGENHLPAQCIHLANLRITRSNTLVDCHGGVIDGEGKRGPGIEIDSQGHPLENVTIRNCTVRNARHQGIMIGWSGPDSAKIHLPRPAIYEATPRNIRLENVTVMNTHRVGVYIDDYVSDVLIDRLVVQGSGGAGIYITHSSRRTTVRRSNISHNGHALNREGIAIDSSIDNVVADSVIEDNFVGGIFIYRNCWEKFNVDPNQVKRWQSADGNLIKNNRISGGRVGVWIASRQSRIMKGCGNEYYGGGLYTLDSAQHNRVTGNDISAVERGVVVEDDWNEVDGNKFSGIRAIAILVGSFPRYFHLNRPVIGTVVRDNQFQGKNKQVEYIAGSHP